MKQFIYLCILALFFLGTFFSYLNPGDVTLDYYFGSITLAKPIFVFIVLALGLIIGLLFTVIVFIKLKRTNYKLKCKIALANKELENLRTMPIRDRH